MRAPTRSTSARSSAPKGLEFAEVVVVQAPGELLDHPADSDSDDGTAETREFQRRELYVAMTRARHGLWVGVA